MRSSSRTTSATPRRTVSRSWVVALVATIVAGGLVALAPLPQAAATPPTPAPTVQVAGNRFVDENGATLVLRGVNLPGSEYACSGSYDPGPPSKINPGFGLTHTPITQAHIDAMKTWNINAVRVPLNDACWNGKSYIPAAYRGAPYREAIEDTVDLLTTNGLVTVLDLHWSDGAYPVETKCPVVEALCQKPMPGLDAIPFWQSVAQTFKTNRSVIFDLFGEPFPEITSDWVSTNADWNCLLTGDACQGLGSSVAGMQDLVDAVRSTGAQNVVTVPGLNFSTNLSKWLDYKPSDPTGNLAASPHLYNDIHCADEACWQRELAPVIAAVPTLFGEFGQRDLSDPYVCAHDFTDRLMPWMDAQGASYFAYGWAVWDNLPDPCALGPTLITDFDGTPTAYGQGVRDHLAALAAGQPIIPSAFDFEDGTNQGWKRRYGPTTTTANNSGVRVVSGKRALDVSLSGVGWPSVATSTGLGALAPGGVVTMRIWAPAGSPRQVRTLAYDASWTIHLNPVQTLSPGWNTVAFNAPTGGQTKEIGVQFENPQGWVGSYFIDAVTFSPPGTDTLPPSVPSGLVSSDLSTSSAKVSWSAATDNVGVTHYRVLRDGTQIGTTTTTSYVDTGLTASTDYTYTIRAVDAAGNVSAPSTALSVATAINPVPIIPSVFDFEDGTLHGWQAHYAPSVALANSNAKAASGGRSLAISLADPGYPTINTTTRMNEVAPGATVKLRMWAPAGSPLVAKPYVENMGEYPAFLGTTTLNPNAWKEITFTVPDYAIRSIGIQMDNPNGWTGTYYLDAVSISGVSTGDTTAPTVPIGLTAGAVTPTSIPLSWTASTDDVGVTEYRILREGTQVGTTTSTSFTDTGLTPSTSYSYTVRAVDAAGNVSAASTPLTVSTATQPKPLIPSRFDFEGTTADGWTTSGPATVASSNLQAASGGRSLGVSLTGAGTPSVKTTTGLAALKPNSVVTTRVWAPSGSPLKAQGYVMDGSSTVAGATTTLTPNAWNTVEIAVGNVTTVSEIGLRLDNPSGWTGTYYVDAVEFPQNGFEDGTVSGWWTLFGGGSVTLSNSSTAAFQGTRSLALTLNDTETYSGSWTDANLDGLAQGKTVTYRVFVPTDAPANLQFRPFTVEPGEGWNVVYGETQTVARGSWQTVTYAYPFAGPSRGIGLRVDNDAGWTGTLFVDAVRW